MRRPQPQPHPPPRATSIRPSEHLGLGPTACDSSRQKKIPLCSILVSSLVQPRLASSIGALDELCIDVAIFREFEIEF